MAGEAEGREELRPSSTSHLAPPPSSEPLALLPALADLTVLCGQRFRDDGRKGSSTFFGSARDRWQGANTHLVAVTFQCCLSAP